MVYMAIQQKKKNKAVGFFLAYDRGNTLNWKIPKHKPLEEFSPRIPFDQVFSKGCYYKPVSSLPADATYIGVQAPLCSPLHMPEGSYAIFVDCKLVIMLSVCFNILYVSVFLRYDCLVYSGKLLLTMYNQATNYNIKGRSVFIQK